MTVSKLRSVPSAPGLVFTALCAAVAIAVPVPSSAQETVSVPVVQALPSRESLELSAALSRLSRDPRSVDALVDAGNAASEIGDFDAAIGFFTRGQELSPKNPRLLAGLAGALARHGDPVAAIKLFGQAEAAGASPAMIAADRGLAYDLAGDAASAQRYYQMAMSNGASDEIRRRLGISYAISGNADASEETLMPLLRKQDKAGWRARAFALAIQGDSKEAIKITKTLLPARLADSISPYMQYMPRLTAAQQAAAANLGLFPRASEIGRDGAAIAAFTAAPAETGTRIASADRALVSAGKPLGSAAAASPSRPSQATARTDKVMRADRKAERAAPPEPQPAREAGSADEPAFAVATRPAVPPVAGILSGRAEPSKATANPARTSVPSSSPAHAPTPGFVLSRTPAAAPATAKPEIVLPAAPEPSFSELFRDFAKPAGAMAPIVGAVDIRKIEPARPAPKPAPKPAPPPPPSHPSRIWVQLGIGQKLPALAYDWRRMERGHPQLFEKHKPFTAKLNQTNRLLTGPFASQKEANGFIADLHKAGIDGPYIWTSPAGEVVDSLAH